jgi:hypothetical protein
MLIKIKKLVLLNLLLQKYDILLKEIHSKINVIESKLDK